MAMTEFANMWGYGRQLATKLTRTKTPVFVITIQLVVVSEQLYMDGQVLRKKIGKSYPQLGVKSYRVPATQLPTRVDVVGRVMMMLRL